MKRFIISVFLFGFIVSCNKTLDVIPYVSLSEETVFNNIERIELAIAGVYDAAQSGFYVGGLAPRGYPFGAGNLQQDDLRGEDMINMESFYQITYNSTYTNTSPNCTNMYNNLYALINKANLTIEGIEIAINNSVISDEKGKEYIAECRFLRAMALHQALIEFARPYADGKGSQLGVVIRDFAVKDDETIERAGKIGRSTVSDCYGSIEDDLDFAESHLPETRASFNTYRATKAAAIALKMRIYLHKEEWNNVLIEGGKIAKLSGGVYSSPIGGWTLTPLPDGPFTNNTSEESIFSLENTPTDNASVSGAMQSMYGSNGSDIGARGLIGVSPILWNLPYWNLNDLRRELVKPNFVNDDPNTAPSGKKPMYFTDKYRDPAWGDDAPQIRYAEVLLNLAEAYARANQIVDITALSYLNAVRNRSLSDVADHYTLGSFASVNEFIIAVLAERRIEFFGEGKRWGDIHRLAVDPIFNNFTLTGTSSLSGGIPAKVLISNINGSNFKTLYSGIEDYGNLPKGLAAIPYSDYRFIWPISASEITNDPNKVIEQNPNY